MYVRSEERWYISYERSQERLVLLDSNGGGGDNNDCGHNNRKGDSNGGGTRDNDDDDIRTDDNGTSRNTLKLYMTLLNRLALARKVTSSTALTAISDIIAQKVSGVEALDWRRITAMGLVSALLTAPLFHYIYNNLVRIIPSKLGVRNTITQLAIDQLIGAPFCLALIAPEY